VTEAPWPLLDDAEGEAIPPGLRVCDAHVHLFPARVHAALRRWFAAHAWPVRYELDAEGVLAFLRARRVERAVGLCYSHAPGMAEELNAFMAALAARHRDLLVPLGTVLPGEPGAREVARRALGEHGLRGLKLHCHVQGVAADDPRLDPIYEEAVAARRPVVIHAGPAPACAGYRCDPATLCRPEAVGRALARH
jgi:predicted TIM-barrel fold metal-dependent hydrolase